MKTIGVLTSGGDAPGMNACIRAVVRAALYRSVETVGVSRGYSGLWSGDAQALTSRSVGGIARWGGTILQTARCEEFCTPEGFQKGINNIRTLGIEGLVVIGGDGSLRGARELHNAGIPCVGAPASIDNDICGTDMAIGTDTATNTILEALDKIKDTASAHQRAFVVGVMGRRSGYLALAAGVAGGAEMVIVPERPMSMEEIVKEMAQARERGKPHFIIVVAEGARPTATDICECLNTVAGPKYEARLTVLGHVQRGGSPTAADRLLATKLGASAVEMLLSGQSGIMVGIRAGRPVAMPLDEVLAEERPADEELVRLEEMMAL
ncbi:MAG TPA: 6-phosphofructokinase [Armatimonadota bacterium]|nr:6-phosphofructokinase [Armatimonadota bacterium]